jgi:hypothetical protein
MKLELTINGNKFSIQRETFEAEVAFDDFLNLLFVAGIELEDIEEILKLSNNKLKENHKKDESKTIKGLSNL